MNVNNNERKIFCSVRVRVSVHIKINNLILQSRTDYGLTGNDTTSVARRNTNCLPSKLVVPCAKILFKVIMHKIVLDFAPFQAQNFVKALLFDN